MLNGCRCRVNCGLALYPCNNGEGEKWPESMQRIQWTSHSAAFCLVSFITLKWCCNSDIWWVMNCWTGVWASMIRHSVPTSQHTLCIEYDCMSQHWGLRGLNRSVCNGHAVSHRLDLDVVYFLNGSLQPFHFCKNPNRLGLTRLCGGMCYWRYVLLEVCVTGGMCYSTLSDVFSLSPRPSQWSNFEVIESCQME